MKNSVRQTQFISITCLLPFPAIHLQIWRVLATSVPRIILHSVAILSGKGGGRRLEICQDGTAMVIFVLVYFFLQKTKMKEVDRKSAVDTILA